MSKVIAKISLILVMVGALGACSSNQFYHENMMRGQIVRAAGDEVVLCIGGQGDAVKGMTFNVFDVSYSGSMTEGNDNYVVEHTGTVTINEVIDEHFARGTVKSGVVEKNDIVELDN
jgi:hypothetical protein